MVDSNEEDLNMPNMSRQKIVFVGDVSVGKTSIINRFVDNKFREGYEVMRILLIKAFNRSRLQFKDTSNKGKKSQTSNLGLCRARAIQVFDSYLH
jgi:GTPase SAR1 family protein